MLKFYLIKIKVKFQFTVHPACWTLLPSNSHLPDSLWESCLWLRGVTGIAEVTQGRLVGRTGLLIRESPPHLPDWQEVYSFKGVTNDTTEFSFKVPASSDFGNIFVKVEVPENVPQIIIELLDEKDKFLEKQIITSTTKVEFKHLSPKKYKLRAILDNDANGRWSPGDYGKKQLPEAVHYHKDVFDVKANWDIDLEETWSF